MAQVEGEIIISRPPEVVFDLVADERNEPSFNPRMVRAELVSGEPIGSGTQFRAATKSMGRLLEMTIEYTGYERPSRLDSVTHMPSAETRGTLRFEPVPAGTRMVVGCGTSWFRQVLSADRHSPRATPGTENMGKPQAASGGVGGPTELAGGAAATAADFQPRCPRNVAQNDTRRRRATARGLAPDSAGSCAWIGVP